MLPDPERMMARLRGFGVRFDEETLP